MLLAKDSTSSLPAEVSSCSSDARARAISPSNGSRNALSYLSAPITDLSTWRPSLPGVNWLGEDEYA